MDSRVYHSGREAALVLHRLSKDPSYDQPNPRILVNDAEIEIQVLSRHHEFLAHTRCLSGDARQRLPPSRGDARLKC